MNSDPPALAIPAPGVRPIITARSCARSSLSNSQRAPRGRSTPALSSASAGVLRRRRRCSPTTPGRCARPSASSLRSLAEHALDGSLELERLDALPDERVIAELTQVRGIGIWSAHMFLIFHLRRPDVLPTGDLGVRRAVMRRYGLGALPQPAALEAIAAPWRPHRTLACRYLWRSLDATPI